MVGASPERGTDMTYTELGTVLLLLSGSVLCLSCSWSLFHHRRVR